MNGAQRQVDSSDKLNVFKVYFSPLVGYRSLPTRTVYKYFFEFYSNNKLFAFSCNPFLETL